MSSTPNSHFSFELVPFWVLIPKRSVPAMEWEHEGPICDSNQWKYYWWPSEGLSEEHAQKAWRILVNRGPWSRGYCASRAAGTTRDEVSFLLRRATMMKQHLHIFPLQLLLPPGSTSAGDRNTSSPLQSLMTANTDSQWLTIDLTNSHSHSTECWVLSEDTLLLWN